jgi:lysophospholipase L1-like esterase
MNYLWTCLFILASMVFAGRGVASDTVTCGRMPLASDGIGVPVRAVFTQNRFQYLPSTLRRLLIGDDLQVVALGDSIVGDTFGPQYAGVGYHLGTAWGVEQVASTFKTNIYAGVSVLGSTGAWYYRLPGNVQTYVLAYQPDLVVIGGISNRNDIDAIRDVIVQIRAANPATEFILMTGAVNLQSMPTSSLLVLNASDDSYEARLSRLADEVGAAFINMRGSYDEFVIEANRAVPSVDQAYFQRDPIHANDRGRAILREMFTSFFRPTVPCLDRAMPRSRVANPALLTLTSVNSQLTSGEPTIGPQPLPVGSLSVGSMETIIDQTNGDIDQDGNQDSLVLFSIPGDDTERLRITPSVAGSMPTAITLPLNLLGGKSMFLTDIDGDGRLDLVIGTDASQPYLYIYINSGVAGRWFFDPILLQKSGDSACTVAMKTVDMNADGRNDLVVANGCFAQGVVDYYQIASDVALDQLLPESYQTGLDIAGLEVSSASDEHLGPTVLVYGSANGRPQVKELGVARPAITPTAVPTTQNGGGAIAWIDAMFLIVLAGVRLRRVPRKLNSAADDIELHEVAP